MFIGNVGEEVGEMIIGVLEGDQEAEGAMYLAESGSGASDHVLIFVARASAGAHNITEVFAKFLSLCIESGRLADPVDSWLFHPESNKGPVQ